MSAATNKQLLLRAKRFRYPLLEVSGLKNHDKNPVWALRMPSFEKLFPSFANNAVMSHQTQPADNETDSVSILDNRRQTDQLVRPFGQRKAGFRSDFWYKSHDDILEIVMRFLRYHRANRYKSPDDLYQKSLRMTKNLRKDGRKSDL